jgi:SNF2 family DNA or RNA helicase
MKLLNILMHLRKVCNHPFLFDDDFDSFYTKFKNNQIEVEEDDKPQVKQNGHDTPNGETKKKKRKSRGQLEELVGKYYFVAVDQHITDRAQTRQSQD